MSDRRRVNGPSGGTNPPVFTKILQGREDCATHKPSRTRHPCALRKMYLKTGITPSASGSAYLELESPATEGGATESHHSSPTISGLKITCTVYGPRPLPRSVPFSPTIILSTHVKYAPFATQQRRGYIRDASERDLAVHLESALSGVIIGDRWPKSGMEVVVTILEGEVDYWWRDGQGLSSSHGAVGTGHWSVMGILSGCITVASAAIANAGIDCVDMVSGGIAALVRIREDGSEHKESTTPTTCAIVMDPIPSEHSEILAACVVGYLPSRDEITDLWLRGSVQKPGEGTLAYDNFSHEQLVDGAIQAAVGAYRVLTAAVREAATIKVG